MGRERHAAGDYNAADARRQLRRARRNVNAAAFYILAALIVAGSAATVLLPAVFSAYAALGATAVVTGILCALTGAIGLGTVEVVLPLVTGLVAWAVLRRVDGGLRFTAERFPPAGWWTGGAVAGGFALLAIVVVAASGSAWHSGTTAAGLVAVIHYWAPYVLGIAAAVAVAAVAIGFIAGRTSADEHHVDRAAEERRRREELARRRRESRAAARRGPAAAGGGQ
jgi:hypothetical protein